MDFPNEIENDEKKADCSTTGKVPVEKTNRDEFLGGIEFGIEFTVCAPLSASLCGIKKAPMVSKTLAKYSYRDVAVKIGSIRFGEILEN